MENSIKTAIELLTKRIKDGCSSNDALKYGQAALNLANTELKSTASNLSDDGPWKVGEKYLIRTATHYMTGRLVSIHAHELLLDEAAWIADTGRFADALKSGVLNEVEPIFGGLQIVGRGAIVDACMWCHNLPTTQK